MRPPRHYEMRFCDWGCRAGILAAPGWEAWNPWLLQTRVINCDHSSTFPQLFHPWSKCDWGRNRNTANCSTPTVHFPPQGSHLQSRASFDKDDSVSADPQSARPTLTDSARAVTLRWDFKIWIKHLIFDFRFFLFRCHFLMDTNYCSCDTRSEINLFMNFWINRGSFVLSFLS